MAKSKDENADTSPEVAQPVVAQPTEQDMAWAVFLDKARLVNPERFDRQKAAGEFNSLPSRWVDSTGRLWTN